ncbi:hypothetical protein FRC20_011881 [Serendipita sp. 405]|nr:hypothetical protein FRC20_011881 [Serendipita sp. 405]
MDDLLFSAKKKRKVLADEDDELRLTPKKARLSHATPAKLQTPLIGTPIPSRLSTSKTTKPSEALPEEHRHLIAVHTALEQGMSVALATAQISPDPDTGRVPAVLNHLSLQERGLGVRLTVEDLKKLCWIWEWDGETVPELLTNRMSISPEKPVINGKNKDGKKKKNAKKVDEDDDSDVEGEIITEDPEVNPFVTKPKSLEADEDNPPTPLPMADLPPLPKPPAVPKLVQMITSSTPRKLTFPSPSQFPTPLKSLPSTPSSSHKNTLEGPSKDSDGFKIPFPVIPGEGPVTPHGPRPIGVPSSGSSAGAVTPSSGRSKGIRTPSFGKAAAKLAAAYTPTSDGRVTPTSGHRDEGSSVPTTPTNAIASSVPNTVETPASARRAALYERIRARSESEGESSKKTAVTASVRSAEKLSARKVVKMVGPEELRRRCILGRLGTIAEAVWMLFSATGGTGSLVTTSTRKRRALEKSEVVRAVVKSSTVPISDAEAIESLTLLCELCPFFLRSKVIGGEEWLEMPASSAPIATSGSESPTRINSTTLGQPGSPTRRPATAANLLGSPTRRQVIEDELMNRSPKRIKKEEGGLRQVRERIRRELEVDDEDDPFI